MDPQADPGEAHQQRQQHRRQLQQGPRTAEGQASVSRDGGGAVAAGEGIALRRQVIDIRLRLHRLEAADRGMVAVWAAAEDHVLDHGIEYRGRGQVHAQEPPVFLVITPVKEADDPHHRQLLSKHGDQGGQGHGGGAHMRLQPLRQGDFPGKEKAQFHV